MPNPVQNKILSLFDFNSNQFESILPDILPFQSNNITYDSFNTYESSEFETSGLFSDLYSGLDLSSYFNPIQPTSAFDNFNRQEMAFRDIWTDVQRPIRYPQTQTYNKTYTHKDPQNHATKKQSLFGSIRNKINDFAEKFIYPVTGRITSLYGERIHPILGYKKFHNGVDIAAPQGTPVLASAGGTVIKVDNNGTGPSGNHVVIRHSNGYTSSYCHLSSTNVTDGQTISQKDFIGRVGSTGRSTGPHLHFTLKRGNSTENPMNHLHHA